jgi:hypothetical protein
MSEKRQHEAIERLGFAERGFTLPTTLDLSRSSFWQPGDWSSNVILGVFEGVETVAFDFEHRSDFGYTQTVVAMKSDSSISALPTLLRVSEIRAERVGEWVVMFRPKENIPLEKLSAMLVDCRILIQHFEDSQHDGPRPHS